MTGIWTALKAPFHPSKVSWRLGATKRDKTSGIALAYIDARDVMERLDEVVGPENWECRYPHAGQKTVCEISIFVDGKWVVKADGAGDSDVEAEKGALSDAFKRAAVRFGIGRYLYDLGDTWVDIEARGNSYAIKKSEYPKLEAALTRLSGMELKPVPQQPMPKAQSREPFDNISKGIRQIEQTGTLEELTKWYKSHSAIIERFPTDWDDEIMAQFTQAKETLKAKAA